MLTEKRIRDAKPGPKPAFLWDGQVKGFGLRVFPTGHKAFVLKYRDAAGRTKLATLARASEISLADARERAARELVKMRDGETDPLQRRQEARNAPTVADLCARFLTDYAPGRIERGRLTERTLREYRLQIDKYVLPALGRSKVAAVTRGDVESMVAGLPGTTRNRVLALASRLFTLAEHWEIRPQHSNPARGIERAREEPRDRTLSASELAGLSSALTERAERCPASVAAIRFAAVTGLRIGEILAIRWEHVDFETGRLTMPETKTGRRVHDLPAPALAVLAGLPRWNACPWVFTGSGTAAVTYRTVRQHFAEAARAAGLDDVRLHDLRRTVMTSAAAAGVGTHVLRDLLGHKTTAMADRYVRAVGNPVRDAREQVGATMAAMMDGGEAKVVPLRR